MPLPEMAIRPRTPWEAIDLGILLGRQHLALLTGSWALLTLPCFLLLSLLCWERPTLAILLFWWLKPLFDRLPLYILAHALFGETPTLRQSLRAFPGQARHQWLASLTWRRLSATRSFDLPVQQLEGLAGAARQQRLRVLGQRDSGTAAWLTIVGLHLELALWLGLLALLYAAIPQPLLENRDWLQLLGQSGDWLWLEHLSNLLYALVLIVWEPLYVACGFSLYLNRRTLLEGWDIELGFRRLRQRLAGTGLALLLGSLLLWPDIGPARAAPPDTPEALRQELDSERLTSQLLNSRQAHEAIATLLDQPPFVHRETVTRWRFIDDGKPADSGFGAFLKGLSGLPLDGLATLVEVLLWTLVLGLLGALLWRHRQWLRVFAARPDRRTATPASPPTVLFGLDVAPESLPDDVAGTAAQLWDSQPRQALGLLYRAMLSHLLHVAGLPLRAAHTEREILQLTDTLQQEELSRFAATLTMHWERLAYGHQAPPADARAALCDGFRRWFARSGAPA